MATTLGAESPEITSSSDSNAQETMPSSSPPVEMSEIKTSSTSAAVEEDMEAEEKEASRQNTTAGAEREITNTSEPPNAETETELATTAQPPPSEKQEEEGEEEELTHQSTEPNTPPKTRPTRKQSEALGPATDLPVITPSNTTTSGPVLFITLMLTTGVRHPYKIDEKYLRNRKVEAIDPVSRDFDPREMSGYKLKELIWTDWRGEWEPRPASPSSIRLIILGRLIDDKMCLKDFPFKIDDTNVVHMTVKPADFLDDDDTGGKKGHSIRGTDGEERGAGCCRCVIL